MTTRLGNSVAYIEQNQHSMYITIISENGVYTQELLKEK